MSIRGIDTHLIVPRTADMVREMQQQQQQPQASQQFSAILTEQAVERNATIANEVLEGKDSDAVDEDGQGGDGQAAGRRGGKKRGPDKGDPHYAGMSESHIDIKV